jgi:hypothetical protein
LKAGVTPSHEELFRELWISLASLLRSYTAVHGLSSKRQAEIEADEKTIQVSDGASLLVLSRSGANVRWEFANGDSGELELTESGRLRSNTSEEEMDLAAESWAREIMRESKQ